MQEQNYKLNFAGQNNYAGLDTHLEHIISVHVHHTILSLNIKSKANNSFVSNATSTLSTSEKTGISDDNGFMSIKQIRKGVAIFIIKANGINDYTGNVNLVCGHDNHFDIQIQKNSKS